MDQSTSSESQGPRVTLAMIWRTVRRGRRLIWIITGCTTALALLVAIFGTPRYDATVVLAPASVDSGSAEGAMGGLGGLAALAGLGGGHQDVEQTLVILKSQTFLQQFLLSENILPLMYPDQWDPVNKRWHTDDTVLGRIGSLLSTMHSWISPEPQAPPSDGSPDMWHAYRSFARLVRVEEDKRTRLITLSVGWKVPPIAARWANDLVRRINQEIRARAVAESSANLAYVADQLGRTQVFELRQALYHIAESEQKHAMVANTHEDFALRVLAPAEVPRERTFPKRSLLVLGGVIGGLLFGALVVLAHAMLNGAIWRPGADA